MGFVSYEIQKHVFFKEQTVNLTIITYMAAEIRRETYGITMGGIFSSIIILLTFHSFFLWCAGPNRKKEHFLSVSWNGVSHVRKCRK